LPRRYRTLRYKPAKEGGIVLMIELKAAEIILFDIFEILVNDFFTIFHLICLDIVT
jgi:hypothetical protein